MAGRTALYCRVSTEEQRTENQRAPLVEWAEREGLSYVVFEEVASGAKQSRTELDKLLKGVRAGEFSSVAVVKLDRLGRSLKHLLQVIEEFNNKGVRFISLNEGFDTSTPQGRLFFSIAGAFAEFERELIRERVGAGLNTARRAGKRLGRPPGSKDKKIRRKSGYYNRWAGGSR